MFFFDENGIENGENVFENIKHLDDNGIEYWYARELQKVLEYTEWRNFSKVIEKAREACDGSGNHINSHFVDVNKMAELGLGTKRKMNDVMLSRYACYLIVQNADPSKEIIALGQTYFAIQTRKQELIENYDELSENQKRLAIRKEMKEHNKSLAQAAQNAGIIEPRDYAIFQNHGYKGLYGGLTANDIHKKKGLKKNQKILDHMGSTELAANLFRATQTDEKLRRDNITSTSEANSTHYAVGKKVRQTIAELGGTMPEDLPTPDKSIKQVEKELKKLEKTSQLKKSNYE